MVINIGELMTRMQKAFQDQICRTRRPDLITLLITILHAIHVCMQYLIHMQEGLWNL